MELRDRLTRLGYFKSPPAGQPATTSSADAPEPSALGESVPVATRPARFPDLPDLVAGEHRTTADGPCFVARTRLPLDHVHGGAAVSDLLGAAGEAFALLGGDPRLAALDPTRTVVLDIETTGLAGGTGTWVFLVGLAYFADGELRIDQFFMRDPGEERAMLLAVGELLSGFEALITFNGKCFDWQLLAQRHVMMRLPLRPADPLHLDLLFPARRLYRRRVGSCALDQLEASVLGLPPRVDDVPGWLIPTLYFDYLRQRDGRPLVGVFEHNRRDLQSMLALAVRMARHAGDPIGGAPDEPLDLYSLGRLFEDQGLSGRAIDCYERAYSTLECPEVRAEVLGRVAAVHKRRRDADRAVEIWESLVATDVGSAYAYVELAKHLEHRRRDYARAAELTRAALLRHSRARAGSSPGRWTSDRADLEKRLSRLERKLALA